MHYYSHHIGDFIKDTSNLTDHQLATYLRMIWAYYSDEKPFTKNLERIAFAMRSDEKTIGLILDHYFKDTEDGWVHSRCEREISAFHAKKEKASLSAKARWNNANALRTHCESGANEHKNDANQEPITNKQEPNKKKKNNTQLSVADNFDFSKWPSSPSKEIFSDWLKVRKAKRLATTQTAINLLGKEITKAVSFGHTVDACVSLCALKGWGGFKYEWLEKEGLHPQVANVNTVFCGDCLFRGNPCKTIETTPACEKYRTTDAEH